MSKMAVIVVGEDKELAATMASAIQYGLEEWGFESVTATKALTSNPNWIDPYDDREAENKISSMLDALEATRPKMFETHILIDHATGSVSATQETNYRYDFTSKEVHLDNLTRESESRTFVRTDPPAIYDTRSFRDPWGDEMIRSASGRFHG